MEETISIPEIGKVFAIKGDKASTATMLISLSERLRTKGVLFIDAGHCFNQFFVKMNYTKKRIKLNRIYVARPFTLDQMKTLISDLKTNLVRHSAKAIVVTGFDRFISRLPQCEQAYEAEQLISELESITRIHDCVSFIGLSKKSDVEDIILEKVQMCTWV